MLYFSANMGALSLNRLPASTSNRFVFGIKNLQSRWVKISIAGGLKFTIYKSLIIKKENQLDKKKTAAAQNSISLILILILILMLGGLSERENMI